MQIDYDPPEIEWIAGRAAPNRIVAHAADGTRSYGERDVFARDAVPWVRFEIAPLFADLEFPR